VCEPFIERCVGRKARLKAIEHKLRFFMAWSNDRKSDEQLWESLGDEVSLAWKRLVKRAAIFQAQAGAGESILVHWSGLGDAIRSSEHSMDP